MKYLTYSAVLISLFCFGCSVGTDFKDDEVIDVRIISEKTQFLVGESATFSARLKNCFQDEFEGVVTWVSDAPSIAAVDQNGVVTAISKGQTIISASYQTISSTSPLMITVSESSSEVSSVVILLPDELDAVMEINETLQLSITARDFLGNPINDVEISWESTNTEVAEVDQSGLVTALTDGIAKIIATANGVSSNPLEIMVGNVARNGDFSGLNGYTVNGSVTVAPNGDDLEITFGSDFSAQNGPGLFVYLSNSSNSVSGGVELGALQSTSGAQTYTANDVSLESYNYVLVHCKPFNVPFGTAQLD